MSYPATLHNTASLEDLLYRKEMAQLKVPHRKATVIYRNPPFLDALISKENHLFLHPHQQFVRNFMSPHNNRRRILCKHETGTGKTPMALALAFSYIQLYKVQYHFNEEKSTPLVFIIGFSKHIFQRELLNRPEFGFVTRDEILERKRLRQLAESGSQLDKDALADYEARLRKRLTKKNWGGFFKFIGYKEFFNRLFIFSEEALRSAKRGTQPIVDSEDLISTPAPREVPIIGDEDFILDGLKKGTITLNYELVEAMANSVLICDEFQNIYNSMDINNYGVALHILFNLYDIPDKMAEIIPMSRHIVGASAVTFIDLLKNSSLWAIFLTATPIGSNPTECIDVINFLVPTSELPHQRKLQKEDFFLTDKNLKPHALEQIRQLITGYVSFLHNENPKYFPERIIDGEVIPIPEKYLKQRASSYHGLILPYLKFIRCPMSELHWHTYKKIYEGTLPPDGQSLIDMVLPNPGIMPTESSDLEQITGAEQFDTALSSYIENLDEDPVSGGAEPLIGLFRSKDIRYSLMNASQAWKDRHKIEFIKQEGENYYIITGEFMRMPTLGQYSTKYAIMMEYIFENLRSGGGKIHISHQAVRMSGVLFIQEVLLRNGILDEYATPTADTLCARCGIRMRSHKSEHTFTPARFIMAHGDIDHTTIERSIDRYRMPENTDGDLYRIIVGSKLLNVGFDLNAVRNLWIMCVPVNISTLLQIFGRDIRTGSHLLLPPEKRNVHIKIVVSSLPTAALRRTELTYEERKYFEKLQDYVVIQLIESVFNSAAIDSILYRDTIFPSGKHRLAQGELGLLYYEPAPVFGKRLLEIAHNKREFLPRELTLSTFYPYYSSEEISLIVYIIKRLLQEQSPVWTYADLWEAVKNPPFDVYVNPGLFLEDDFLLALYKLIGPHQVDKSDLISGTPLSTKGLLTRLFDPEDAYIIQQGRECRLVQRGPYYMLLPLNKPAISEISNSDNYSLATLGPSTIALKGTPLTDVDSWYRREPIAGSMSLRITNFLKTSNISYHQMKYKFYNQYRDTSVDQMPTTIEVYDLDFHVHLVEDAIRYIFNIYVWKDMPFSELHTFYFKMLYFYDRLEMILFADQVQDTKLFENYKPYCTHVNLKYGIHAENISIRAQLEEDHQYNPFLFTSIFKSETESTTVPFNIKRLNEFLGRRPESEMPKHPKLADMDLQKTLTKIHHRAAPNKVFSNLLPIGHFLTTNLEANSIHHAIMPKVYIPSAEGVANQKLWIKSGEFLLTKENKEKENDIIVGYYEKNPFGIDVKFKLRAPLHKIEMHEDTRLIERGSACATRHKDDLLHITKKLELTNVSTDSSIRDICLAIKLELMHREMKERRRWKHLSERAQKNESRTRYFYLHFEKQPIDF